MRRQDIKKDNSQKQRRGKEKKGEVMKRKGDDLFHSSFLLSLKRGEI